MSGTKKKPEVNVSVRQVALVVSPHTGILRCSRIPSCRNRVRRESLFRQLRRVLQEHQRRTGLK